MSDTTFEWDDKNLADIIILAWLKGTKREGVTPSTLIDEFKASNQPVQKSWNDQQECLAKREMGQGPWQILTFADKNSKIKWHLNVQGGYGSMNWSLEEMLKDRNKSIRTGDLIIESVRRNSDGEVFVINDTIIHQNESDNILYFEVTVNAKNGKNAMGVKGLKSYYWLENIRKMPSKLFTTTDGVDIFEGDKYWMVTNGWKVVSNETHECLGFNTFSTESAAIAYVHENKPIYSIKDFREIIKAFEERIALKTP